jgi:hypothetical protein
MEKFDTFYFFKRVVLVLLLLSSTIVIFQLDKSKSDDNLRKNMTKMIVKITDAKYVGKRRGRMCVLYFNIQNKGETYFYTNSSSPFCDCKSHINKTFLMIYDSTNVANHKLLTYREMYSEYDLAIPVGLELIKPCK